MKFVRVEMEVVDHGVAQLFEILVSPKPPSLAREPRSITGGDRNARDSGASSGSGVGGSSRSSSCRESSRGGRTSSGARTGAAESVSGGSSGISISGVDGAMGAREGSGNVKKCLRGTRGAGGDVGLDSGGGGGVGKGVGGDGVKCSRGEPTSKVPLELDYGDVYEGMLYQRRSFVIVNHASMPLEFQLSSSLPASELNFSLSAVTLKQFKSVTVEAKTRLQVFPHYKPVSKKDTTGGEESAGGGVAASAGRGGGGGDDRSGRSRDSQSTVVSSSTVASSHPDAGAEVHATAVCERLSITCRLVKDFQQEIQLVARRHDPQLRLRPGFLGGRDISGSGGSGGGGQDQGGGSGTAGSGSGVAAVSILYVVRDSSSPVPSVTNDGVVKDAGAAEAGGSSVNALGDPLYSAEARGGGGGVQVDGELSRFVTVSNMRPRRRVVISVVNVSMYFSVVPVIPESSAAAEVRPGPPGGSREVVTGSGAFGGVRRGWAPAVADGVADGGIEMFELPAGESLTLRVTPRLDKLRSGEGLALLATQQSLEVCLVRACTCECVCIVLVCAVEQRR